MKQHPEYMILIAVAAALVACVIGSVATCSMVTNAVQSAAGNSLPGYNERIEEIEGGADGIDDLIDELLGGHDGNGAQGRDADGSGDDADAADGLAGGYTEDDLPATMDIEAPELQDDLQACLNNALTVRMGSDVTVTVTNLTKESVATPELKAGRVLGKVSGKATIQNSDGKTETVDYTSYYYAADPAAQKITWYIYGYDLGSYSLFPKGFKEVAGDPMGVRDTIDNGVPAPTSELGRDREQDAQKV